MFVRILVAATVVIAAPACAASDGDPESFAADMRKRLAVQMTGASVTADPEDPLSAKVTGGEWEDASVNFHRIFQYCQSASAEDCAASKKEFIEKISKKPPALTKASLRLIVRDAQYLEYARSA